MKKLVLLLSGFLFLMACGENKEELITGKWQEIALEKPKFDRYVQGLQAFNDTFGKNYTPEMNLEIYGVRNADSMRSVLQLYIDSMWMQKQIKIDNQQYEFRKDKIAVITFAGQPDSANWYLQGDNTIMLDDSRLKGGEGQKTTLTILKLSKDTLKLRIIEAEDTSIGTFIPIRK